MKEFVHREVERERRGSTQGEQQWGVVGAGYYVRKMCVGCWRKDHVGGQEERSDVGGRSECNNGGWSRRRLGGRMDRRRGGKIRGDESWECASWRGGGKEEWEGTRTWSGVARENMGRFEQSGAVDGRKSGASNMWMDECIV